MKFFKRTHLRNFTKVKLLKARQLENCLPVDFPNKLENRSSPSEIFLRKDVAKICSKFTGGHPCRRKVARISIKLLALQIYWNHTSVWVISCKFAAYFQNTFLQEHLWRAACGIIYLNFQELITMESLLFRNFGINQFRRTPAQLTKLLQSRK